MCDVISESLLCFEDCFLPSSTALGDKLFSEMLLCTTKASENKFILSVIAVLFCVLASQKPDGGVRLRVHHTLQRTHNAL